MKFNQTYGIHVNNVQLHRQLLPFINIWEWPPPRPRYKNNIQKKKKKNYWAIFGGHTLSWVRGQFPNIGLFLGMYWVRFPFWSISLSYNHTLMHRSFLISNTMILFKLTSSPCSWVRFPFLNKFLGFNSHLGNSDFVPVHNINMSWVRFPILNKFMGSIPIFKACHGFDSNY